MFNWLKAKPPKEIKKWEIKVNGLEEYTVHYILDSPFVPRQLTKESMHFKSLKFGNVVQCETAIAEWEYSQMLQKKRHVKYM